MNVILLGAPGAGKGTQGDLLAARFEARRISTGDMLREAVRQGSPLGRSAREYMDRGDLVPDGVILGIVREALADDSRGVIFDGFPRTLAQAEGLDALFDELGRSLDAVVVVEVPDDVIVRRLSRRRTCAGCGAVFNVDRQSPGEPGTCDECGDRLVQRADDEEETVRRRLAVYREQTRPLIGYYEARRVPVVTVDGHGPIETVQNRIVSLLQGAAAS